jgi:hypothetical protein
MLLFLSRFFQHSKSLKTVIFRGVDEVHEWFPHFVETMIFEHCVITQLDPGKPVYVTKRLKLVDYFRHKYRTTVFINWECFPNLEEVELYVYDVNLNGIEGCKNLRVRKIDRVKN